ncbi:MAG TPA: hypothetical protein VMV69_03945 [Pirellulales bacterium]|nr:hypothetical protein [Pirellulales bacterium]
MEPTTTRGERTNAIRDYISKYPDATAQQVADGLQAEGVHIRPGLVYNVRSYDAKTGGATKAGVRKATVTRSAASTNGAAGGTKADQIREVAKTMSKPVRPRDVVAALKAEGIDVTRTQVSQVLSKMGMRRRRRRKSGSGNSAPVGRSTASRLTSSRSTSSRSTASRSTAISIDDLVAAKKLVAQVGGIEKVKEALAALARLS